MIQLQKSITKHEKKVWCVAAHPTLPLLASCSTDKTVVVYDTNTWSIVTVLSDAHTKTIRSVNWKPTAEPCLACGSFDATMSVWAKTDGTEYDSDEDDDMAEGSSTNKSWSLMAIIEGHENEIKCVSWSQDGQYLASCSRDKTVWIWEADEYNEEFECVNVLQDYHTQDVKHVAYGPSNYLASCSYDDTIKVFKDDGDDAVCVCDLHKAHSGTVWAIAWEFEKADEDGNFNGTRFVSCSDDGSVKVWASSAENDEEWQCEATLPQVHKSTVYSVSWSRKCGKIASVGADGFLVIYKERANKEWVISDKVALAHGVYDINSVCWCVSDDKEFVVTGGDNGSVNVWGW